MEYATLNNAIKMPMEGFGVFQVRDKEECKRSVLDAIKAGVPAHRYCRLLHQRGRRGRGGERGRCPGDLHP